MVNRGCDTHTSLSRRLFFLPQLPSLGKVSLLQVPSVPVVPEVGAVIIRDGLIRRQEDRHLVFRQRNPLIAEIVVGDGPGAVLFGSLIIRPPLLHQLELISGVSPANEMPKINLFATASIYNFPGNSWLGPLIKKKTGMKGKYPDTAVGCRIARNYSFMNEISIANIQGMIHGRLIIYSGVMCFIHTVYHKFF